MPTTQVAFRLDDELVERIDAYAKRLAVKTPGIEYSRADAVRALLARALDAVEADPQLPPLPERPARRR